MNKKLIFAFGSLLVIASVPLGCIKEEPQGEGPYEYDEAMRRLGISKPIFVDPGDILVPQEEGWRRAEQLGMFIPDLEYLKQVKNPIVWSQFFNTYLQEPLTQENLGWIEELLAAVEDRQIAMQCACLLYRYDRSAGEEYLSKKLIEEHDPVAAATFALNKEARYLEPILDVLVREPDLEREFPSAAVPVLIEALGSWQTAGVEESLLAYARRVPMNALLASALAKHSVSEAAEMIEAAFKKYRSNKQASGAKIMAGILIDLTGDEEEYIDFIESALHEELIPNNYVGFNSRNAALRALSMIDSPRAKELLLSQIARLDSVPEERDYEMTPALKVCAAHSLLAVDPGLSPETVGAVEKAMESLPEDSPERLGLAMKLDTSALRKHAGLANKIGEKTLSKVDALRNLKKIPQDQLPATSRTEY